MNDCVVERDAGRAQRLPLHSRGNNLILLKRYGAM